MNLLEPLTGRSSTRPLSTKIVESVHMNMTELLSEELVITNASARRRDELLDALLQKIAASTQEVRVEDLRAAIMEREKLGTTALEGGFALPHARLAGLSRPYGAFARSVAGVDWSAPDGKPTHLVFVFATPAEQPGLHLKLLAVGIPGAARRRLPRAVDGGRRA